MKDISKYFKKDETYEVIWDQTRYKVILFKNDMPIAYKNLSDDENSKSKALEKASILLNGGGTRLTNL